ncbi:MAG: DNA topology modulation protein [Candidatus Methylumidiphilus sp.]
MREHEKPMQRVLVMGSGGAGKSTFSVKLGAKLGLPVLHLDSYFWSAGWVERDKVEWRQTVERLVAQEKWIMDGNYGGTLDIRLAACDTVIFLDRPRLLCLWRVVRRRLRFHGRTRPDMAAGCDEHLTWEFIRYVWHYPYRRRPQILARLSAIKHDKTIVVLQSGCAIEAFLASV